MKFIKNYDFELQYHLGKETIVVNARSKKSLHASMMMVKEFYLDRRY